jgi:putative endonuclease
MQDLSNGFHSYYIYILTNKHRTTFYIGVTNNLKIRLQQHLKTIENPTTSFVSKYKLGYLIYYEKFMWIQEAIAREKELKGWRREKKLDLIKSFNPELSFLNDGFM